MRMGVWGIVVIIWICNIHNTAKSMWILLSMFDCHRTLPLQQGSLFCSSPRSTRSVVVKWKCQGATAAQNQHGCTEWDHWVLNYIQWSSVLGCNTLTLRSIPPHISTTVCGMGFHVWTAAQQDRHELEPYTSSGIRHRWLPSDCPADWETFGKHCSLEQI